MTFKEIFNQLEGLGTERNRKLYMRRGSGQNTYGVSFGNLRQMAKGIGSDHELAVALWESTNVDARALAIMIANPARMDLKTINVWLNDLNYAKLIELLIGLVIKTEYSKTVLNDWIAAKSQHRNVVGYGLMSQMLKKGFEFQGGELEALLKQIKEKVPTASHQLRMAMHKALIAMSIHQPALAHKATALAKRIEKSKNGLP